MLALLRTTRRSKENFRDAVSKAEIKANVTVSDTGKEN